MVIRLHMLLKLVINFQKKLLTGKQCYLNDSEARLSLIRKICKVETLKKIYEVYRKNNLSYTYKKFNKARVIKNLIPFLRNDKKNNDDKINFILLKKIGAVDKPNKNKISLKNFKNYIETLIQY